MIDTARIVTGGKILPSQRVREFESGQEVAKHVFPIKSPTRVNRWAKVAARVGVEPTTK